MEADGNYHNSYPEADLFSMVDQFQQNWIQKQDEKSQELREIETDIATLESFCLEIESNLERDSSNLSYLTEQNELFEKHPGESRENIQMLAELKQLETEIYDIEYKQLPSLSQIYA